MQDSHMPFSHTLWAHSTKYVRLINMFSGFVSEFLTFTLVVPYFIFFHTHSPRCFSLSFCLSSFLFYSHLCHMPLYSNWSFFSPFSLFYKPPFFFLAAILFFCFLFVLLLFSIDFGHVIKVIQGTGGFPPIYAWTTVTQPNTTQFQRTVMPTLHLCFNLFMW